MSQQINLFNPAFQPQKKIFSVNAMAAALGTLVLILVGTGVYAKNTDVKMQNKWRKHLGVNAVGDIENTEAARR